MAIKAAQVGVALAGGPDDPSWTNFTARNRVGKSWICRFSQNKVLTADGFHGYIAELWRAWDQRKDGQLTNPPSFLEIKPGKKEAVVRVKMVCGQRRWKIRDRAYRWYCEKQGLTYHSMRGRTPEFREGDPQMPWGHVDNPTTDPREEDDDD